MKLINYILAVALVLNLWFNFFNWLFWLLIADIVLRIVLLVAVRKRNKRLGHGIVQLFKLNSNIDKFNGINDKRFTQQK